MRMVTDCAALCLVGALSGWCQELSRAETAKEVAAAKAAGGLGDTKQIKSRLNTLLEKSSLYVWVTLFKSTLFRCRVRHCSARECRG
jgi:hypothetical protein